MSTITIDGPQGKLATTEVGDGAALPVVFIHSDGGNRHHWDAALIHLAASREAIAVDLRGHGESDVPLDGDMSYEGRAADVGAALDRFSMERAIVVGHSGGGAVALTFAVAHPNRVAGLLLVDPASDPRSMPEAERTALMEKLQGDGYAELVSNYYASVGGPNETVRDRVVHDILANPKETVVGTFTALNEFAPETLAGRYRGPTLTLVTPSTDTEFGLHRIGAGTPSMVIEGTGHWIHLDKPEEFNRILDGFLSVVDKADRQPAHRAA